MKTPSAVRATFLVVSDQLRTDGKDLEQQEVTTPATFGIFPDVAGHLASEPVRIQSGSGATATGVDAGLDPDILPATPRRRRGSKEELGLPDDGKLRRFARAFIDEQRGLWPELDEKGPIPTPSDSVIEEMVEGFKARRAAGKVSPADVPLVGKLVKSLAAIYPRYSDENSQPVSVIDQARKAVRRAKKDGAFVPW